MFVCLNSYWVKRWNRTVQISIERHICNILKLLDYIGWLTLKLHFVAPNPLPNQWSSSAICLTAWCAATFFTSGTISINLCCSKSHMEYFLILDGHEPGFVNFAEVKENTTCHSSFYNRKLKTNYKTFH